MENNFENIKHLFLEHTKVNKTESTFNSYRRKLDAFVSFCSKNDIYEPTETDIERYKYSIKNLSPNSINAYIGVIKSMYEYASKRKLADNVAENIELVKVSTNHRKEPVSPEGIRLMIDASCCKRDKAIIALMVTCGLRTIEVSRLQRTDFVGERLRVWGKGHAEADTSIHVPVKVQKLINEYLQERKDNMESLFVSESNRKASSLSPMSISHMVKQTLRSIGIDSKLITAHSLRHTCATTALTNGASLLETQMLMRHVSPVTTERYQHYITEQNNRTSDLIAKIL